MCKQGQASCPSSSHAAYAIPVRGDEGFFNAVAVMHIQVQVQHPCMVFQQLQDGKHEVVHITEACAVHKLTCRGDWWRHRGLDSTGWQRLMTEGVSRGHNEVTTEAWSYWVVVLSVILGHIEWSYWVSYRVWHGQCSTQQGTTFSKRMTASDAVHTVCMYNALADTRKLVLT